MRRLIAERLRKIRSERFRLFIWKRLTGGKRGPRFLRLSSWAGDMRVVFDIKQKSQSGTSLTKRMAIWRLHEK